MIDAKNVEHTGTHLVRNYVGQIWRRPLPPFSPVARTTNVRVTPNEKERLHKTAGYPVCGFRIICGDIGTKFPQAALGGSGKLDAHYVSFALRSLGLGSSSGLPQEFSHSMTSSPETVSPRSISNSACSIAAR